MTMTAHQKFAFDVNILLFVDDKQAFIWQDLSNDFVLLSLLWFAQYCTVYVQLQHVYSTTEVTLN